MKQNGQLNIEFIIDVALFSAIIFVIVGIIISEIPRAYSIHEENYVKSKTYQISEILLFDRGDPINWTSESMDKIKRFGFSSGKNYYVNMTKINKFLNFCNNNYTGVLSKFDIKDRDIVVIIRNSNGIIGECGIKRKESYSTIKRFGIFYNETEGKYETVGIEIGVY